MISPVGSALSGLNASSRRIAVAADNIANQFSNNYTPSQVDQVSLSNGGVLAREKAVTPDKVQIFNPVDPNADASGLVSMPNVDVANELVSMSIASYNFKANLKSIKVSDEMQKSLLDILS
jgi:flagellar basal-body rod protein FlgC